MAGNNNPHNNPQGWLAEKQGFGNPEDWMAEKQGIGGSSADWIAEKQGIGGSPADWMAEKQGVGGSPADWMAEKQGISGQKIVRKRLDARIWGIVVFLIAVLAIAVVFVLGTGAKKTVATPTVAVVVVPTATPIPVINIGATATAIAANASNNLAAQAEAGYQQGLKDSSNQATWEQAITDFVGVNAIQPNYKDTNNQLIALYKEEGYLLISKATDASMVESVKEGDGYLNKARTLAPNDAQINTSIEEAEFYINGVQKIDEQKWQDAITELSPLYKLDSNYKDATQQLYNAYVKYGDSLANSNKAGEALINYSLAAALPVKDNSLAKSKVLALDQQFGKTPTP